MGNEEDGGRVRDLGGVCSIPSLYGDGIEVAWFILAHERFWIVRTAKVLR